ncbi:Asp23/Gls24 family envelope stress response protein [Bacillus cereus]|uniref:Putative alkaline-shock protein n=1 Tax=Bacillus cereus TaxID=1396 RepID=A0A164QQ58_BACCE|nr:Asp23/Gls24 family envelope stress response protein [Bacillus cereus]KZD72020.1 putative alkaline-shock protein [Bacillus cereus]HDR8320354.1 Asp23/Gls24 family envelope stress response protein [Bacillus cereus]HDR8328453.1 Asp23/Gls24 family envelope stress response protein [Bacillus cereus]HDR8334216.1 Asp23/Gls24 family envelope stress response protein [Bacillus cereus]
MEINSNHGKIEVTEDVIAQMAGNIVMSIPGIVGMVSVKRIKDGVAELLKREQYQKGIVILKNEDGIDLRLHVVMVSGMRLVDIAANVQNQVYEQMGQFGLQINQVHVCIEGIQIQG